MVKHLGWLILWGALLLPQQVLAGVNATLDSYIVSFGESVVLTVKVEGSVDGEPDFTPLKQEFDILSQNQSSNYSYVNGSFNRSKTWSLNLMPKRKGMVQVPPIHFEKEQTKALMLRVLDAKAAQGQHSQAVWLKMTLSSPSVYVQAQNILTVKLFRTVNLSQASLSEPDIANVVVQRLGDDKNYEAVVDGRKVVVTERRYATFPQESGDITLPSIQFDGVVAASSRSMFNQGKVLRVLAKSITMHVLPKPNDWDKQQTWLPAKDMFLQEVWADTQTPTYKVGEPFTRTIELKATGLTSAQIPPLYTTQNIVGFKQYPDQPVLKQNVVADGLLGIRQEKIAMVPTHAGQLTLPAIKVTWWNTQTHEKQTVMIAARVIDVLPSDVAHPASNTASPVVQHETAVAQKVTEPKATEPKVQKNGNVDIAQNVSSDFWQWFALLFALAWLMTVFLWWKSSREKGRTKPSNTPNQGSEGNTKVLQKQLEDACKQNDAKRVILLFPQWAAAFFDEPDIQYVGQLQGRSSLLDEALVALNQCLYGANPEHDWKGEVLLKAIASLAEKSQQQQKKVKLKGLYEA